MHSAYDRCLAVMMSSIVRETSYVARARQLYLADFCSLKSNQISLNPIVYGAPRTLRYVIKRKTFFLRCALARHLL